MLFLDCWKVLQREVLYDTNKNVTQSPQIFGLLAFFKWEISNKAKQLCESISGSEKGQRKLVVKKASVNLWTLSNFFVYVIFYAILKI